MHDLSRVDTYKKGANLGTHAHFRINPSRLFSTCSQCALLHACARRNACSLATCLCISFPSGHLQSHAHLRFLTNSARLLSTLPSRRASLHQVDTCNSARLFSTARVGTRVCICRVALARARQWSGKKLKLWRTHWRRGWTVYLCPFPGSLLVLLTPVLRLQRRLHRLRAPGFGRTNWTGSSGFTAFRVSSVAWEFIQGLPNTCNLPE